MHLIGSADIQVCVANQHFIGNKDIRVRNLKIFYCEFLIDKILRSKPNGKPNGGIIFEVVLQINIIGASQITNKIPCNGIVYTGVKHISKIFKHRKCINTQSNIALFRKYWNSPFGNHVDFLRLYHISNTNGASDN